MHLAVISAYPTGFGFMSRASPTLDSVWNTDALMMMVMTMMMMLNNRLAGRHHCAATLAHAVPKPGTYWSTSNANQERNTTRGDASQSAQPSCHVNVWQAHHRTAAASHPDGDLDTPRPPFRRLRVRPAALRPTRWTAARLAQQEGGQEGGPAMEPSSARSQWLPAVRRA